MIRKDDQPRSAAELRMRAEAMATQGPDGLEDLSQEQIRLILHELRVHQIELEMQNEELRRTQVEVAAARARYFDLYDLAPVGYCSISEKGLILESNFTAATLLGITRGALVNQLFTRFIFAADADVYYLYRRNLFKTNGNNACDLRMVRQKGDIFWARLNSSAAQEVDGQQVTRLALSDISEQKGAEAKLAEDRRQRHLPRLTSNSSGA